MVMRSVKSSVKGWKAAAARLAVLIVIVVQALGLGAVWPQEPAEPRLDEEFDQAGKNLPAAGAPMFPAATSPIEGSRTTRSFFPPASATLSAGWELGPLAGYRRGRRAGHTGLLRTRRRRAVGCKVRAARRKARAVAISIEDRRTDKWQQEAASLGDDRIRYLSGKRLRQYSSEELGKFQIITDVFGGFTYTEDLSQFVDKVLSLLEVGGGFYTLVPGVHLEDGKEEPRHLLSDRAGECGRPPRESVLLAEKDRLRESQLRV